MTRATTHAMAFITWCRVLLRRAGRLPLTIMALWVFACGAHAVLARSLAMESHAAAMLSAPTDLTLLMGVLLVATRLMVFLALPVALAVVIGWRLGARLGEHATRVVRKRQPISDPNASGQTE